MADTTPNREALIALKARRTAHRVATDIRLAKRSRLTRKECPSCHEFFLTDRPDQTLCEHCLTLERADWPKLVQSPRCVEQPVPRKWRIVQWVVLLGQWLVSIVLLCVCVFAMLQPSYSSDPKEPDPTQIIERIAAADKLKETDPRAAIKQYEQVREMVDGRPIRNREARDALVAMNRSWTDAMRALSKPPATQP